MTERLGDEPADGEIEQSESASVVGSMAQNNAIDDVDASKKETESTRSGERWEDHKGKRFTTEVTDNGVICHYDDGSEEGPFAIQEFENSRENLNYLGDSQ